MLLRKCPPAPWFHPRAGVGCQLSELTAGNRQGMTHVRSSDVARSLLADECTDALVVAALVASRDHGIRRLRVMAAARSGRLQIAPRSAEQVGILSYCQRKNDQEQDCSEHERLAVKNRKNRTNEDVIRKRANRFDITLATVSPLQPCGISPRSGEKFALSSAAFLLWRQNGRPWLRTVGSHFCCVGALGGSAGFA